MNINQPIYMFLLHLDNEHYFLILSQIWFFFQFLYPQNIKIKLTISSLIVYTSQFPFIIHIYSSIF